MPSPFDITVATNTVVLDNNRQGIATFTVHNNTRRRIRAAAQVTIQPPDGAAWLTIAAPDVPTASEADARDFPIDATQQYQVKIAVPMTAAPGSYTLKLTVADSANPDDNFSVSPDVQFTVNAIAAPVHKPFPTWIVPAVLIGVVVIVGLILGGVALSNHPTPTATLTPTAGGPCTITLSNVQDTYTQPDTRHLFDESHTDEFHPALIAHAKSADDKWWQVTETIIGTDGTHNSYTVWLETDLLKHTAVVAGDCSQLPATCLVQIIADQNVYGKPNSVNDPNVGVTMVHVGEQMVATGKLADGSWWKLDSFGSDWWIASSAFGTMATNSGNCSGLPLS